jgi:hypothetical protein
MKQNEPYKPRPSVLVKRVKFWQAGGRVIKLKGHQRTLYIERFKLALRNTDNPFVMLRYVQPRHVRNRIAQDILSKRKPTTTTTMRRENVTAEDPTIAGTRAED